MGKCTQSLCSCQAASGQPLTLVEGDSPDTRFPKWSMTLKLRLGRTLPLAKPEMTVSATLDALMAAAALAKLPPKPSVELLPSQSSQLAAEAVEFALAGSAQQAAHQSQSTGLWGITALLQHGPICLQSSRWGYCPSTPHSTTAAIVRLVPLASAQQAMHHQHWPSRRTV